MNRNRTHSPKDNARLLLAFALSAIILFCWQYFYQMPRQHEMNLARQAAEQERISRFAVETRHDEPVKTGKIAIARPDALRLSKRVEVISGDLRGSVSLTGARIDDLSLTKYAATLNSKDSVTLLSPSRSGEAYFAELGWLSASKGVTLPDASTQWESSALTLTPNAPVMLYWENGEGLRFEIEMAVDEHYMFSIKQRVINHSEREVRLAPYGLISQTYRKPEKKSPQLSHDGLIGVFNDVLEEVTYDHLEKKEKNRKTFENASGWLGITQKYWLTALIPADDKFKATFQRFPGEAGEDRFQADYLLEPRSVASGVTQESETRLFAGAKRLHLLDAYGEQYGIHLFDRAVDFGALYFLTRPLFLLLSYFNVLFGNFAIAILMLTVVIKILLYPLAHASYKGMARMKELTPKMKEIRERYAEDKLRMNQEIMALYKREKVNPAGGCLPLLLQLPVFIALYKVLLVAIEMRHAPFYGWIEDMSVPDPTNIFTLFGLLPWDAPALLQVGLWPIIMTITMIIQQKMSPKPTDPGQAWMMTWMPYLFLFLFATFPAGLVIYWAWSNVLSIGQQWMITRQVARSKEKKKQRGSEA